MCVVFLEKKIKNSSFFSNSYWLIQGQSLSVCCYWYILKCNEAKWHHWVNMCGFLRRNLQNSSFFSKFYWLIQGQSWSEWAVYTLFQMHCFILYIYKTTNGIIYNIFTKYFYLESLWPGNVHIFYESEEFLCKSIYQ